MKLIALLALLAWTAFFAWLWVSGDAVQYVGPRTSWVVPFGAIGLGLLTGGVLVSLLRGGERLRRPTLNQLTAVAIFVAPLLLVVSLPGATLGALIAQQKDAAGSKAPLPAAPGPDSRSFADIAAATEYPDFGKAISLEPGDPVTVTGFVSLAEPPGGGLELSRLQISCCAADAVPTTVRVLPGPGLPRGRTFTPNEWLQVRGRMRKRPDGRLGLAADRVVKTRAPANGAY